MKNEASWRPSKYIRRGKSWVHSKDTRELGIASRLIADSIAKIYSKHLNAYASGRLLDLGCGKAPLYGIYHDLVDSVTCSDWIDSVHIDVIADLGQSLPFLSSSFDTIILSDVLEHVPDPDLLWREMTRILAPGGHIVMNVPFFYWLHAHPHDFYRYTNFALSRFVSINSLELLRLETLGGVMEVWADLHAKLFARVPWIGGWLAKLVQSGVVVWGRSNSGKRLAEVSARHFPLGYFVVARKS